MLIDSDILFRRRVVFFITASAIFFVFALAVLGRSYGGVRSSLTKSHGREQLALSHEIAAIAAENINQMGAHTAQVAAAAGTRCPSDAAWCAKTLGAQMPLLAPQGAMDIYFVDSTGNVRASVNRFFSQRGQEGWPPEVEHLRETALHSTSRDVIYSRQFIYFDEKKKERPAYAIAAPVFATVSQVVPVPASDAARAASGTTVEPATMTVQISKCAGAVIVPVSLGPLSARIQQASRKSGDKMTIMFGPEARIVSYPDAEFVGANGREIFNLTSFPRLENIINRAVDGHEGAEEYEYSSGAQNEALVDWMMAYSPVVSKAGPFAAAVAYKKSGIPMYGDFLGRYLSAAVICLLLLVLLNLLPLIEHRRRLTTNDELKRMQDTLAINEMLRNVNQELTETKKTLEKKTRAANHLQEKRLRLVEQLTTTQYRLFGTIKKPDREQRELMRTLKKDIQAMGRSSETGRFWKKDDTK